MDDMTTTAQGKGRGDLYSRPHGWLAVASIAAGTFLLVTTEFLPIGLLSRFARDLDVSEGVAGLSVTAPGFVAAIFAPLVTIFAGSIDRRQIILCLTAFIVASNLVAAFAPDFAVFLIGRLLLGLAVGGLWTFAVAVGRRLVAESAGARATSIISMGISAGTICGMPVGAIIGDWGGWRIAFAINAALGLLIVFSQAGLLPRLPAQTVIDPRRLLAFFKIPMARAGLLACGLIAAGHFIGYTFLEPYLRGSVRLGQNAVAWTLAAYALAGILGAFLGERIAVRNIRWALICSAALLGAAIVCASVSAGRPGVAQFLIMVWGVAFGAIPVCVQIWMFTSSPELYEAGSALMVSAFQISLAAGAAGGGAIVDFAGVNSAFVAGGMVTFSGAIVALLYRPSLNVCRFSHQREIHRETNTI